MGSTVFNHHHITVVGVDAVGVVNVVLERYHDGACCLQLVRVRCPLVKVRLVLFEHPEGRGTDQVQSTIQVEHKAESLWAHLLSIECELEAGLAVPVTVRSTGNLVEGMSTHRTTLKN